ncbi:MAG: hypothetical protein CVT49_09440 [candidate division Zixibacteria bacterium HGW-Zixibacteria-1]|nr:MAG: hypothetical protein CVT49_09440 [candidate division Zixibacteria bacterium HGW-Zixibacteria-1]
MKNLFLHVVASGEMRQTRISKRGNHAASDMKTTITPKCDEIATSLILARRLGFAPRNDDQEIGRITHSANGGISDPALFMPIHPLPGNGHSIFLKKQKQSQFRVNSSHGRARSLRTPAC